MAKIPRDADADGAAIRSWRKHPYPRPAVTVDVVILTVVDVDLKVLLVTREKPPFAGSDSLPGGFVHVGDDGDDPGEDLDSAAARVLEAKTGLAARSLYLEQLYTFGKADRDPRGRVITVAYYALVRPDLVPFVEARPDRESNARWVAMAEALDRPLAFDHHEILKTALARIRGKIDYTDIAFGLVPATFTIAELRSVHEVIKGTSSDPGNFRRRFNRMLEDGLIEKAQGRRITVSRPASVYRFKRQS